MRRRDAGSARKGRYKRVRLAVHWGLSIALLLIGWGAEPAAAARLTKEPTGFNGYAWESPPADYPSLQLLSGPNDAHPLPGVDVYENPGEVVTVNGVTFTQVQYRFFMGKLGAIHLKYEGMENRDKLRQWIEENYGKMPPVERKQRNMEWHGENTVITLGFDRPSNGGRLWFINLVLSPFDNATTDTGGY